MSDLEEWKVNKELAENINTWKSLMKTCLNLAYMESSRSIKKVCILVQYFNFCNILEIKIGACWRVREKVWVSPKILI